MRKDGGKIIRPHAPKMSVSHARYLNVLILDEQVTFLKKFIEVFNQ